MAIFRKRDTEASAPSIVLLRVSGQDAPVRFAHALGPGEDVIGRDETCTIQVTDAQISRRHVSICFQHQAGGFVAADMDSANGTLVNGQPLVDPVLLVDGDVIEVGHSRLVFTTRPVADPSASGMKDYGERFRSTMPDDAENAGPPGPS